jgi:putative phosphoesterase
MRIAVFTDVHGNILAMEAIMKGIKDQGVDKVAFLGDIMMTGPRPQEVFDALSAMNPDIWIRGNTDDWFSEINEDFVPKNEKEIRIKGNVLWAKPRIKAGVMDVLSQKPISTDCTFENVDITFCHGSPGDYYQGIKYDMDKDELEEIYAGTKSRIIVCGHTHIRLNMRYRDLTVQNFGPVSIPLDGSFRDARYGIIQISSSGEAAFINRECPFDLDAYFKDMEQLGYPEVDAIKGNYNYR